MRIPLYQIDAFTDVPLRGNPAAVCPLDAWVDDRTLQSIAAENNLSETAFLVPQDRDYRLRWFTPAVEVDLCGHATLASAYAVFHYLQPERNAVTFHTRSGALPVTRAGDWLTLDFPTLASEPCKPPEALLHAVGGLPTEVLRSREYVVFYATEGEVRRVAPDMHALTHEVDRGVIFHRARH